jgi:leucyl-tRNA synthetase
MINSDFLNGLSVSDAIETMLKWLEDKDIGKKQTNFKLRDWVFSRQRYWGEPIPVVHCDKCGYVPLPEDQLPLVLPEVESFTPSDDGQSPLAKATDWVHTTCPKCGGPAMRETDTMPQWAGSSWYFMRFIDPHNDEALADFDKLQYWLPVDWYNGGMEHTTLHLLYSRFWYKFLYDLGVAPTKEPYQRRTSHGMILGENGEKMSKSRGNVVNPDDIIDIYGADTLRLYEVFIGDFEKVATWNTQSIKGSKRFLDRLWVLQDMVKPGDAYSAKHETLMHQTIKKVGSDIDELKGNTAIAQLMTLLNQFYDAGELNEAEYKTFLILVNPFCPHITEELWERGGYEGHISDQNWPLYDEAKTVEDTVEIAVQVNGKVRGRVVIAIDMEKDQVLALAKEDESVKRNIEGKSIVKEIYIPGRLVNIVVK